MHQGVQLHITDHTIFMPFITGLHIIKTTMDMYPEHNLFKYKNRVRMFNKVMGNDSIMKALLSGKTIKEIENDWQNELDIFISIRNNYLIY